MLRWAMIGVAVVAVATSQLGMTPIDCGLKYRSCACRFVDRRGWECKGFTARTASEEPPKFPDEERSKPIPVDPSEVVPIQ